MQRFLPYEVAFMGGCCGTTPQHIACLKAAVQNHVLRSRRVEPLGRLSCREFVVEIGGNTLPKMMPIWQTMGYIADAKQQINARQFLANQVHSAQCFLRTIYIGTYCEHQTIQINILSFYTILLAGSHNTLERGAIGRP